MTEPDVSLWQALGISPADALDQIPDDVWDSALAHAVDPAASEMDSSLVPDMDDAAPQPIGGDVDGDLAGLLHDDPGPGHDDGDGIDLGGGVDDHGFTGHHHDGDEDIDLDENGL
ncbi:hypothetical protein [Prescottella equi]|uniref:hypothetical protein n=1 Tax=Rhodococcus hoagii TaxID=43767 RepID=UPI0007CD6898|nr:hypothetical protein [Prescottella equi]